MTIEQLFKRIVDGHPKKRAPEGEDVERGLSLLYPLLSIRVTGTNIAHWVRCRDTGAESYDETSECPFCDETAQLGTESFKMCIHYVTDHEGYVLWSEGE